MNQTLVGQVDYKRYWARPAHRCNEAETLPSLPKERLEYYSNETLSERCAHYTSLFFRVITLKLFLRLAWIEFRHIHCGNLSACSLIRVWIIELCMFVLDQILSVSLVRRQKPRQTRVVNNSDLGCEVQSDSDQIFYPLVLRDVWVAVNVFLSTKNKTSE